MAEEHECVYVDHHCIICHKLCSHFDINVWDSGSKKRRLFCSYCNAELSADNAKKEVETPNFDILKIDFGSSVNNVKEKVEIVDNKVPDFDILKINFEPSGDNVKKEDEAPKFDMSRIKFGAGVLSREEFLELLKAQAELDSEDN